MQNTGCFPSFNSPIEQLSTVGRQAESGEAEGFSNTPVQGVQQTSAHAKCSQLSVITNLVISLTETVKSMSNLKNNLGNNGVDSPS